MSQLPMVGPTAPASTWQMYRAMVGIGLLCGLLIVAVFELTRPVIERNKAEALQRAIFVVLPEARSSTTFRLGDDGHFTPLQGKADGAEVVYAGYDGSDRLVGIAVEAEGMGYQDVIRLLYGYSFEREAIIGLHVLESKETPGLGTRIETDPTFLKNFEHLDVTLSKDRTHLEHAIEFVKPGHKEHPWQVDGITGATISSTAVATILRQSTAYWIPRIRPNIDDFEKVPRP